MAGQAAGNASCHLATGVPEMSMIPDETPTAPARGIGDNQPPSPIETLVAAQKEAQTKALEERLAYIVGRADAKDIVDRENAGQAGDLIKVANEFMAQLQRDRIALPRPSRDAPDAGQETRTQHLLTHPHHHHTQRRQAQNHPD